MINDGCNFLCNHVKEQVLFFLVVAPEIASLLFFVKYIYLDFPIA